jgi:hypothetical protein
VTTAAAESKAAESKAAVRSREPWDALAIDEVHDLNI